MVVKIQVKVFWVLTVTNISEDHAGYVFRVKFARPSGL